MGCRELLSHSTYLEDFEIWPLNVHAIDNFLGRARQFENISTCGYSSPSQSSYDNNDEHNSDGLHKHENDDQDDLALVEIEEG